MVNGQWSMVKKIIIARIDITRKEVVKKIKPAWSTFRILIII